MSWLGSTALIGCMVRLGATGKSDPSMSRTSKRMNEKTNAMHTRYTASMKVEQRASRDRDRKSTRLNSSHLVISYAVFCLKKKKKKNKKSKNMRRRSQI